MSSEIRRWLQTLLGAAIIVYALGFERDANLKWKYVGIGALLFDPEHVLKAIGLWKGQSSSEESAPEAKP
jgi:hypothetical protein